MDENEKSMKKFYDTKVKDIMLTSKSDIPCIVASADIMQVLSSLKNKDHIWIMDSTEPTRLLGIITQSDTLAFFSPTLTSPQSFDSPDPRSMQFGITFTAEEIMSKKPVSVSPDETIRDILKMMKEQKIKYLPVVDDQGNLIGEVTLSDIIQEYSKQIGQPGPKGKIEII
jgi:CBS-domain-containing membrane protein